MSMFEDHRYRWRETYFVLFRTTGRPKLKKVEHLLTGLDHRYQISNLRKGDDDAFESLTLISPDDYAGLDICYTEGDEVREQLDDLLKELRPSELSAAGQQALKQLAECDARFDVLHFEQISVDEDFEDEEMLDPSSLLLVLTALAKLVGGVAVDPQSGIILENDQ